jgi:hypothetical protein
MPANIEAADPQGVPRYLASSSDGKTASDPARMLHDIEPKACQSVPISITTAGTTTLVTGVASKVVRATSIALSADAACEVTLKSSTNTEAGPFYLGARTPFAIANLGGIFDCAAGENLQITVTAAVAFNLGGIIGYRMVDS